MSNVLSQEHVVTESPAEQFDVGPTISASEHATIRMAQHRMMIRSKLNVRRKSTSVSELAALIRSQGLLQNLVGFQQVVDGVPTGRIGIVAGGRRLDAVAELIAQGDLPADYQIPYL